MYIYQRVFFIICLFCLSNFAIADHSLGYIRPFQDVINVLSEPESTAIAGSLSKVVDKMSGNSSYEYLLAGSVEKLNISKDMVGTGYKAEESFYPLYYKVVGSYAKILSHSTPGYWLEIKQGDELVTPTKELTQYIEYQIYGYDRYRLRKNADITSETIVTLSEQKHIIKGWTGRVNGSWAEAIVVELSMGDLNKVKGCGSVTKEMQLINHYTGWIKVANNKGKLRDISYVSSC